MGTSRPVEWLASLKAMAALDADIFIPGHGEVVRGRDYLDLVIEILGAVYPARIVGAPLYDANGANMRA